MRAQWQREREVIEQIRKVQPEIELRSDAEQARRADLGRAASTGASRLEKKVVEQGARRRCRKTSYLREEVTDQDIAGSSRWTIPVKPG